MKETKYALDQDLAERLGQVYDSRLPRFELLAIQVVRLLRLVSSEFARINNEQFKDTEEVRYDIPASLILRDSFVGVASDGSDTAEGVWTVVKTTHDANGNKARSRVRTGVKWDFRTEGWT